MTCARPTTVVDLDGTWVKCNTLSVYVRKGILKLLSEHRYAALLQAVSIIIQRKMRIVSHASMKYRLLSIIPADKPFLISFSATIQRHINPNVAMFIEERRRAGDTILLATAASASYIEYIWDGKYLASRSEAQELFGVAKRDAVAEWMVANNASISYFLTDDISDLPMAIYTAEHGGKTLLVNPSARNLHKFAAHNIFDTL